MVVAGPVPACLWLLTTRRPSPPVHSILDALLDLAVTWTAAQVVLGLTLALAGGFTVAVLLGAESVLLLAGFALLRGTGPRSVLAFFAWRRAISVTEAALLLALGIVAGSAAWELMRQPTTNFDSLAYHLPVMATWVQSGRLEIFPALGQTALYPSHWELLGAMVFLPMQHDLLVSLPNLLAWAHLGLAFQAVCHTLGTPRLSALCAAGLVLTLPTVVARLDAIQPDLALTAFLLSATFYAVRWLRTRDAFDLALLLVCAGMIAGLKMSGPIYAGLVLGPTFLTTRWSRRSYATAATPRAGGIRVVAPALLAATLLAAAWYGRNLAAVGNPAGLLEVKLGGWTLFEGSLTRQELARTTLAAIFDPARREHWSILARVIREWLGVPFLALLVFAAGGILQGAKRRAALRTTLGLGVAFVAALTLYAYTPFSGDNGEHGYELTPWIHVGLRYGFPALAILAILAARGVGSHRIATGAMAVTVVASSVLAVVFTVTPTYWALWIVAILCFATVLALHRRDSLPTLSAAIRLGFAVLVLALLAWGTWVASSMRDGERARQYGRVFTFLEERLDPDARLGYVNTPKLYPLLGRRWQRHLVPALPQSEDARNWVSRLRGLRLAALVVGHAEPSGRHRRAIAHAQSWVREPETGLVLLHDFESQLHDMAVYGWQ